MSVNYTSTSLFLCGHNSSIYNAGTRWNKDAFVVMTPDNLRRLFKLLFDAWRHISSLKVKTFGESKIALTSIHIYECDIMYRN